MAGTIETTEEKIHKYRFEVFAKLGFGPEDSELLADARQDNGFLIDVEIARKLIRSGCSHALAKRILL
jgi:hypothetical protein